MTINDYIEHIEFEKKTSAFIIDGNSILNTKRMQSIIHPFREDMWREKKSNPELYILAQKIHYYLSIHGIQFNGFLDIMSMIRLYNLFTKCSDFHDQDIVYDMIFRPCLYRYRKNEHFVRKVFLDNIISDKWFRCTEQYIITEYFTETQFKLKKLIQVRYG